MTQTVHGIITYATIILFCFLTCFVIIPQLIKVIMGKGDKND